MARLFCIAPSVHVFIVLGMIGFFEEPQFIHGEQPAFFRDAISHAQITFSKRDKISGSRALFFMTIGITLHGRWYNSAVAIV
jgi:hypothetical protein